MNTVDGKLIESNRDSSTLIFDRRISISHAGADMHCSVPGLYIYISG